MSTTLPVYVVVGSLGLFISSQSSTITSSGGSRGVSLVAVETPFLDGAVRSHVLQSSLGT